MNARSPQPAFQHDVLMLCERLPCSAIDPATMRAFHILQYLSRLSRVHLACFIDPRGPRFPASRVRALCFEHCMVARSASAQRLAAWRARASGKPAALACAGDETLAAWIARLRRRHPIGSAIACSPAMASYLLPLDGMLRAVDFGTTGTPGSHREQRLLARYEDEVARRCEMGLLARPGHAGAPHLLAMPDGVDCDDFSPFVLRRNPYPSGAIPVLLARPHGAAADAATDMLVRQVFGPLHAANPRLRLYLPAGAQHRALLYLPGVQLFDGAADLRPHLAHAALILSAAPSADILAAMAMQKAVVATPEALAACAITPGAGVLSGSDAAQLRGHVLAALDPAIARALGRAARARALREFGWDAQLAPLSMLVQGVSHAC